MMYEEEFVFIQTELFGFLQNITEQTQPLWGKMNAQQMVEHLTDFFNVSTEKIIFPLVTAEEHLPKYREFLYSDKEFRENTKAPASVLGEEPLPLRAPTMQKAKDKLKDAVDNFINYFDAVKGKTTLHPVFGQLSFDEWLLLHSKHIRHHLRQFGATF